MKEIERRRKISNIILSVVLCIVSIILIFLINSSMFHKDEIPAVQGRYEAKVYVTPTGDCYHHYSCSYVTTIYEIGIQQAKNSGYRACQHCGGMSSGQIYIEGKAKVPAKDDYFSSAIISFLVVFSVGGLIYSALWHKYEDEITEFNKSQSSTTYNATRKDKE